MATMSYIVDSSSLLEHPTLIQESKLSGTYIVPLAALTAIEQAKHTLHDGEAQLQAQQCSEWIRQLLQKESCHKTADGDIVVSLSDHKQVIISKRDYFDQTNGNQETADDQKITLISANTICCSVAIRKEWSLLHPRDVPLQPPYCGWLAAAASAEVINDFSQRGIALYPEDTNLPPPEVPPPRNCLISLSSYDNPTKRAIGYFANGLIRPFLDFRQENLYPCQIAPKNLEQRLALYTLTPPPKDSRVVLLTGPAGTAKTYLSLAVAIEQTKVIDGKATGRYDKIYLSRAVIDDKLGYRKGDFDAKYFPHMSAVMNHIQSLHLAEWEQKSTKRSEKEDRAPIEIETLNDIRNILRIFPTTITSLRGATIDNSVIIADDAQNFTFKDLKTFLGRVGKNCLLIINGDPTQSDLPPSERGSLQQLSRLLMNEPDAWQLHFTETAQARHRIANLANKEVRW